VSGITDADRNREAWELLGKPALNDLELALGMQAVNDARALLLTPGQIRYIVDVLRAARPTVSGSERPGG
jgi:hypothetical protein